jgi:hypothetical protein
MNKLLGFFELKNSLLPTIPWNQFFEDTILDKSCLWTIRSAVIEGNDLNLPRLVGAEAEEAMEFAQDLIRKLSDKGMVIYYPYFIAEKSGTLEVKTESILIEAVKDDLWNLVTFSDRAVTMYFADVYDTSGTTHWINGDSGFLSNKEVMELRKQVTRIRAMFRDYLTEGKSVLLEWSYAYTCDINRNKIGNKYLVFYEARTI